MVIALPQTEIGSQQKGHTDVCQSLVPISLLVKGGGVAL